MEPVVTLTILQLNDVYEITPVAGGREGGLARVATLRNRLLAEDPNLVTVMAGDFYSPSALGTARVDGERLRGKQMVAVLNALGLDIATYGNHEFDLDEEDFLMRVDESDFQYISANVTDDEGALFPNSAPHALLEIEDESGATMILGITGTTLASNPKEYVAYGDPFDTLRDKVEELSEVADVIVALTHLALEDDMRAAAEIPDIDLVLGGHEHENVEVYRGSDFTPVMKADANARTVYVHHLRYDPRTGSLDLVSELVPITDAIPDDPEVTAVVDEWVEVAFRGFRENGFDPGAVVATATEPLDGREASVRNRSTTLTQLIADAMFREGSDVDLAVYNSGSIRIDDVIQPGAVSQYDVIRVLPFGGEILTVEIQGDVLARALTQGVANRGSGGFLQAANATWENETWMIGDEALDPARTYRMAVSDFLVSGRETGLDFFNVEENPGMTLAATHRDIRMAVIDELQRRYGSP
ncbi:MAG: bifunctional metallophosphatase/5'-nucleotidase [Rhodothermaceae bacterium]|nr:bifunctional metallophosphatase/5'-nucleotidase [Rhodothermaceae bacterium]